ncbi:MAG: DUF4400 domain-containing protein [Methylococcaceae bacterium]
MFVRVSLGQKALYLSLILPLIICLAMPESIHTHVVVLPFAVLFGFSVRVMASTFKNFYDANLTAERVIQENVSSSLRGPRQILRDTIYFFELI